MKYVEKYSRGNTICKSAETKQWFVGMISVIWSLKARMYLATVKMVGQYCSKLRGVWGKLSSSVSGLNLTCTHTRAAVTEEGKAVTGWDGGSESVLASIFYYLDCKDILICTVKVQTYPSSKSEAPGGKVQENFLRRWSFKASSLLISCFLSFSASFEREECQTRIQKSWRNIWRRSCSRRWSLSAREPDWSHPKIFHPEFFFSPSLLSSPFPGGSGWPSSTGGHIFFRQVWIGSVCLNIRLNLWVLKCHVIPCTPLNFCERTKERSELLSKQLQDLSNEKQERFWKLSDCKVDFLLVNSLSYHHLRISVDFPPCHFSTSGEGRTRGKTFNWRNLANK